MFIMLTVSHNTNTNLPIRVTQAFSAYIYGFSTAEFILSTWSASLSSVSSQLLSAAFVPAGDKQEEAEMELSRLILL